MNTKVLVDNIIDNSVQRKCVFLKLWISQFRKTIIVENGSVKNKIYTSTINFQKKMFMFLSFLKS